MTKEIESDLFTTKMTVSQAVEKGKEFVEANEISKMINASMGALINIKKEVKWMKK